MIYAFGIFTFSSDSGELYRDGRRVALEPQPARALAALLARAGDVVSRDDMREAIWGAGTHVDYDRGLAYAIGQVRAALGDSAETPRFIQTLPKRGFRFIAPVTPPLAAVSGSTREPGTPGEPAAPGGSAAPGESSAPGGPCGPAHQAAPAPEVPRRRGAIWLALGGAAVLSAVAYLLWPASPPAPAIVAVSIFDNESGDPAHDAFVTGLSDVVVTELTALAPARVGIVGNAAPLRQPRNIRNLKALAASVDAGYVVIGQLQRQEPDLRFILHFIRLSDGVHLSAQRFVRPAGQLAAFEQDVVAEARRVVQRYVLNGAPSSGVATR